MRLGDFPPGSHVNFAHGRSKNGYIVINVAQSSKSILNLKNYGDKVILLALDECRICHSTKDADWMTQEEWEKANET